MGFRLIGQLVDQAGTAMEFRVRTLGGLAIERDGRALAGGVTQPRRLAVLALLARAGSRGMTRDRILVLLWPEAGEERARRALSQALYAVRQELGSEEIILGVQDLRLNPDLISSDVSEFEAALADGRLADAVGSYGGPFLDGFHLSGAPEFERWMEEERLELGSRYLEILERLAIEASDRGDVTGAVAWWRRLAGQDPLNARIALAFMQALIAAGDRIGALQHARVYETLVQDNPGIPLDSEVVALVEQLRIEAAVPRILPAAPPRLATESPEHRPLLDQGVALGPAEVPGPAESLISRRGARNPKWRVPAAVGVFAVGIAAVLIARSQRPDPIAPGTVRRIVFGPGVELDPALGPDGRLLAFSAESGGTMRLFVKQVGGEREVPLAENVPGSQRWPRWSPDGSQIAFQSEGAIHFVPALGGSARPAVKPVKPGDWAAYPTWSPDGRELAYVYNWQIYARPVEGGLSRSIAIQLEHPHSLAWSPDGEWIALVNGNPSFVFGSEPWGTAVNLGNAAPSSIWVAPAAGGDPVRVTSDSSLNTSPVWLPGGRSLLFVSDREGDRDIYQVHLDEQGRPRGPPARITAGLGAHTITLSPDGSWLAYTVFGRMSNLHWLPLPDGDPIPVSDARPLTTGSQAIEGVDVSPDGRWLAFDSDRNGNFDLFKMPANGGEPIQLTSGPMDEFMSSWSPDGRKIAFYSFDNGSRELRIISSDGGKPAPVASRPRNQRFPGWSPDGRELVFGSSATGQMELYLTSRSRGEQWTPPRRLTYGGGASGRWSPRGDEVVYIRSDGLWAITLAGGATRQLLRVDPANDPAPLTVQWSRDGRTVYYKAFDNRGRSSIWSLPATGGEPRLLVQFGDSAYRSTRPEFATDGRRLYFTLSEHRADIWIMEIARQ